MLDPAALAQAGPWAVVVAIGLGFAVAFVRGWVVPGFVYQREVKRGDDALAVVGTMTKSLDALTDEIRWDARDRHSTVRTARDASS